MGFLQWALAFFRANAPETLTHLEDDATTAREAERISAEKLLQDERDCFKLELLRLGLKPNILDAKVKAYRRGLLVEVRRGAA